MSRSHKHSRHILSLSGGKDSAALAVYMRDRVPDMEYVFHDTGHELPETYDYLDRLEVLLGRPIDRSTASLIGSGEHDTPFDHWLVMYGGMIPSNHRRWCTKMMKLKPFEDYVGDDPVINYVGLRADERMREGYISTKPNIKAIYPFQEDGLVKEDIVQILEESGLGMPPYLDWGRSRSGCYFCFYQQKIEWVRLKEAHPDLYEKAKRYEEQSVINGEEFFWCQTESLAELEQPERVAEIKAKDEARRNAPRRPTRLVEMLGGADVIEEEREGCLICFL